MKKTIYIVLTAFLLSGLSACTSYNYYRAAINKTNMSGYHTFAWMPPSRTDHNNMLGSVADIKVKDAATQALLSKGLELNQQHPDLIVTYTAIVGRGARTNYYSPNYYGPGFYPGWGFGYGWGYGWGYGFYRPYYAFGGPFGYYGGLTYAEKEHYKEGTIIIDLIDTRTRRIVWRGFGVGEAHRNLQKTVDDLPRVVNGILNQLDLNPPAMRHNREIS